MEATSFRLEGRRGTFTSLVPRLEWVPTPRLNLRLRVPLDSLTLDGERDSRNGPADTELRLRLHAYTVEPFRVSLGLVSQLPTGSTVDGLGAGALQVTPFLNAGFRHKSFVAYLIVGDSISLAGSEKTRRANWVDPNTDHELRTTLGVIYDFTGTVSAGALVTETIVLVDEDRGRTLMTGAVTLGTQPDRRLRLVIAEAFPVYGERRFAWKLSAAATYAF